MSDINEVVVSGRITREPELRNVGKNSTVLNISMCANRSWKSGNETKESSTFVDVEVWGNRAKALSDVLAKGKYIVVAGELRQSKWTDSDGKSRSKLYVTAKEISIP